LIDFVANKHRAEEIPCRFITLNDAGETIDDLEARGNQAKLEDTLKQWMRARIRQLEDENAKSNAKRLATVLR
jgi:hypothetical protein